MDIRFQYDAVLFDLDGTLLDSSPGIIDCYRYALGVMGLSYELDPHVVIGPPLHMVFSGHMGLDEPSTARAIELYRAQYKSEGMFQSAPYEGIRELLAELAGAPDVQLAVATTKITGVAEAMLEHHGLLKYFDRVCGARPQDTGADKSRTVRAALPERYKRAVLAGDRYFDIQAARDTGIESIGVTYGFAPQGELERAGASYLAESAAQVLAILKGAPTRP